MKSLFVLCCFFSINTWASLEKLNIKNLDLDYTAPYGKGLVEKVGIGVSLAADPFEVEVHKVPGAFDIISRDLDFTWLRPEQFVYDLEALSTKKTSINLGAGKIHSVESEFLMLRPKDGGEYKAYETIGFCEGEVVGKFERRLLGACLKKMELTVHKIDIPLDSLLVKIMDELPLPDSPDADLPAKNFSLIVTDGSYNLSLYVKYWLRFGLRSWGHIQYENDEKILAIRVDEIKFGYLPVTNYVLTKLQESIKHPKITIDPPWIRIDIKSLK